MSFSYQSSEDNNFTRLNLIGRILSSGDLTALNDHLEKIQNWKIILDLSELSHSNSTGLGLLVKILTRSRVKGGDTVILSPNDGLKKLFEITKMHEIFTIFNNEAEAIAYYKQ
ncbi:MAG: hypothetical protein RL264_37 [Bacteroidota bacterium]|jgi:anti-sigma B factor antagonist